MNADHSNIRRVEEIKNYKVQPQRNSPHSTRFHYQQDNLKERLVMFAAKHSFFKNPNLFFDTSKTIECVKADAPLTRLITLCGSRTEWSEYLFEIFAI